MSKPDENSKKPTPQDDYTTLLTFLQQNEVKLKILLAGDERLKPLLYPFKGKRSTKTVFMSEKLQYLINEICIEKDTKIGDFVECAVIHYLVQNGYEERVAPIIEAQNKADAPAVDNNGNASVGNEGGDA